MDFQINALPLASFRPLFSLSDAELSGRNMRRVIYVREAAQQAELAVNEVPDLLRTRMLSLRAYGREGMMVSADVLPGTEVERGIEQLLETPRTAYLHIHYAKPGCYACRVERA